MCWYHYDANNDLLLTLHVQPGAKRTETVGKYGDALKLKLVAPPIEGRANAALRKYLAKCFAVPLSQVILKQGERSRRKLLLVKQSDFGPDVLFDESESGL